MALRSAHLAEVYVHIAQKYGVGVATETLTSFMKRKKLEALTDSVRTHIRSYIHKNTKYNTLQIVLPHSEAARTIDTVTDYVHRTTGIVPSKTEIQIDAKIIGGFKASFRGISYDGSVRRMIDSLQAQ